MPMLETIFRGLPDFRGKRRLGRYIFNSRIRESADILVRGRGDCSYKLPNLTESLALDIFLNGIYEEDTHSFLVKILPRNGVFLDLGANIGSIAIPLCKKRMDIKCIAVEAAPWIFDYLEFNIKLNGLGRMISPVNKAIADTKGGQLPFYSPRGQFGKGSLSPVFTDKAIMVDRITIDELLCTYSLTTVNVIKIDIEGYEYFAFKGGSELLQSEQAPDIIFEFVDWAEELAGLKQGLAQDLLREWGYKLFLFENKRLAELADTIRVGSKLIFASKRYH
jgi:FkbM family methyltransferase